MKKENIKTHAKNLIAPSIMSFVIAFMLFIYEPITTYASNTEDYWFDLKALLTNNLIIFAIVLIILLLISTFIYFIAKKSKKIIIYNIYVITMFVCFISTYIQGNYLAGSLPTLDGTPIVWTNYTLQGIISIVLWILVIALNIVLYKKFKTEKYIKITSYVSIVIFIMLFVSLISVFINNPEIYTKKGTFTPTNKNINTLSKEKNLLILLVDCVDSREFERVVKENNKENVFEDFTYFPDTLSTYGFTRDSIPYIFSGIWYEAQTSYSQHYSNAFDNSKLFHMLQDRQYDINIYDDELFISNNDTYNVKNVEEISPKANFMSFAKQEAKYILFKYLPFQLKKYSRIETLDYAKCKIIQNKDDKNEIYTWLNLNNYELLDDIKVQDNNYFQFVHIEGGHLPYDLNENLEKIENGTYDDKLKATITIINKYLTRIRESGQYDNSAIIILSDHGYNGYEYVGRQNPVLYIKGFNERHSLETSQKKVSFTDLNDSIYLDLLNGKQTNELLMDIREDRIRRYLYYKEYDKMEEQTLDGHAWETEKLIPTGVKYER